MILEVVKEGIRFHLFLLYLAVTEKTHEEGKHFSLPNARETEVKAEMKTSTNVMTEKNEAPRFWKLRKKGLGFIIFILLPES